MALKFPFLLAPLNGLESLKRWTYVIQNTQVQQQYVHTTYKEIDRFVFNEAHTMSSWGDTFCTVYKRVWEEIANHFCIKSDQTTSGCYYQSQTAESTAS